MKVEIYTKANCVYCVRAKSLLQQLNIPYVEYHIVPALGNLINQDQIEYVTRDHLLQRAPEARTVPQIWVNDRHVGGCDDLFELHRQGGLLT